MLDSYLFTIVGNRKRNINRCLQKLSKFLDRKINYEIICDFPFSYQAKKKINQSELVIVLGGDGTTLSVTRCIKNFYRTKIIPVNFGTLGYITSVKEPELFTIIKNYLNYLKTESPLRLKEHLAQEQTGCSINSAHQKQYGFHVDERCLLQMTYRKKRYFCLNEVVLIHKNPSKSIEIKIEINDEPLTQFNGNGIILSTPTGSTAYNLSAGGPILTPHVDAFVLNALSPHSLNLKPIVLSKNEQVKFYTPEKAIIISDGIKIAEITHPVYCKIALEKLAFIKSIEEKHIKVLKKKLNYGYNNKHFSP